MSQFKPNRIVLHCGLHKTGSTYIQRNLQSNRELLLEHGVLYLGPNTFKRRCSKLWRYLQWGRWDRKTPQYLTSETRTTLVELAGKHPEMIHTIVLSFEAIFGTLRSGLADPPRRKSPNRESKTGLYRYAKSRTKRLITGLEDSLEHRSIAWTILFASRSHEAFVRSCHTQLLKEGRHTTESSHFDSFRQTADFSYTDPKKLENRLWKLARKRDLKVVCIDYEQASDPEAPSSFLWNLLKHALPQHAELLQQQLEATSNNSNLHKTTNPGLNERGLELALQAQPLFRRSEWKLFRKFLEKNFARRACHTPETIHFDTFRQTAGFLHTDPQRLKAASPMLTRKSNKEVACIEDDQPSTQEGTRSFLWNLLTHALPLRDALHKIINPNLNERGLELALQAQPLFRHNEWKLFRKFLEKNFAKSS